MLNQTYFADPNLKGRLTTTADRTTLCLARFCRFIRPVILLCFGFVLFVGCQPAEPVDLSEFTATEPPTRTPVPTPTQVVSKPEAVNKISESDNIDYDETIDLIAQLDKIYERLTGIEQFDLNSDMFDGFDGAIQAAIIKINTIAQSGGSEADTRLAYQEAIEELMILANVGKGEIVSVQLAKAGQGIESPSLQGLAQSFKKADAPQISSELSRLGDKVLEIPAAELNQVANDLLKAAAEMAPATEAVREMLANDTLDPDLQATADIATQLAEFAQAIQAGDPEEIIEKLVQLKNVIDAIAPNLELAQFLTQTVENVEKEAVAKRDLKNLFAGDGNVRISQVEIKLVRTSIDEALSIDMLPELTQTDVARSACVLTEAKTVVCLNGSSEWESPAALAPYDGRISALTLCNDQVLISTDKELVFLRGDEAEPFADADFPFKPPTQLECDSADGIWALPAPDLADSPWIYQDETWTHHPTILQNTIGVHSLNIPWGTKFEVNEKSVVRDGKQIDPIPFITRYSVNSWDIYYNVYWETGLWGAVTDQNGEMWFPGSALYYLNDNQTWFGFEGDIGRAFTLLPNGLIMGSNPSTGGVHIFDGSATWWQLSDWPEAFTADVLKTDESGRVWAAGQGGLLVWDGDSWEPLPGLTENPLDFILIEEGAIGLN